MTQSLSFVPRPGAAPVRRMVLAQAGLELRLLLRNGEQVLLTLVIPIVLLLGLSLTDVVDLGTAPSRSRIDVVAPGVIALAIMSTAFTGQAISTGFERSYGVLKRLATTPLPRAGLLAGKTAAVAALEAGQIALLAAVALALGWTPSHSPGDLTMALLLLLAGTAAFSGLALLMAGTLRAEATLAAANLVYLLLLGVGGVVVPLDRYPSGLSDVLALLPLAALAEGLRDTFAPGGEAPWGELAVLILWAVGGLVAAARTFRWE